MTSATAHHPAGASGPVARDAGASVRQGSNLRLALGIYRLDPRGGLEDQCIRLGAELRARGHDVTLFTAVPAFDLPFQCVTLAPAATPSTNHARMHRFADDFSQAIVSGFDRTVAFQPMPGVDVLFCADMPRGGHRSIVDWVSQRHATYAALEEKCFSPAARTRIICLARPQAEAYVRLYRTPSSRVALMPPSIDIARRQPERREKRSALRKALAIAPDQKAWLWLGLHPNTKGLDRVIDALPGAPDVKLLVVGIDREGPRADAPARRARANGSLRRIAWLGYRSGTELLDVMAAADVLVHPARVDVTGAVILEAIVNGLPAVATANCGFSEHIVRSGAGAVIEPPYSDAAFQKALAAVAADPAMGEKGAQYGRTADVYSGLSIAADMIECDEWDGRDWTMRPPASL